MGHGLSRTSARRSGVNWFGENYGTVLDLAVAVLLPLQWVPVQPERAEFAVPDIFERALGVALAVLLAAADGERLAHDRAHGELVDEAAVDTDHRDRAALAAGADRLAEHGDPAAGLEHEYGFGRGQAGTGRCHSLWLPCCSHVGQARGDCSRPEEIVC